MPAATHDWTMSRKNSSPPHPPQELLTTSGRGVWPLRSVGAIIHWPDAISAEYEQESYSHPLAAIHRAPGATPIWFWPVGSSPAMVPMVWVPWPLLSHGAAEG